MEERERVAQAMVRAYLGVLEDAETGEITEWWGMLAEDVKQRWRRTADAAIAAVRQG